MALRDYQLGDLKDDASDALGAYSIYSNVTKGGTVNDARAATKATSLLGKTGIFGDNTSAIEGGAGNAANALGIYTGIEKGGAEGYSSAAINAAQLGARAGAFGAASGAIGEVAGPLAAGLAVYEFAENWKSGDTGGDTIRGAEAGAAVGSVIPVVGTIAGAVIGAAIGAASSMFGPGKQDPESAVWDKYAQVYAKSGASAVSGATPSQNFQLLAGIFDSRGGGANSIPFYAKYGRMGEASFTSDMTTQINQALAKGTIGPSTPASQVYSSVVLPWINSMQPGKTLAQAGKTVDGIPTVGPIQNILTTMIGQYQSGQLTSSTKLGIDGQQIPQLQKYGAMGAPPNTQQIQATVQTHTATFNSTVAGSPFISSAKSAPSAGGTAGAPSAGAAPAAAATSPSSALASMALVMPNLFQENSKMAGANNTQTGTGGSSAAPQASTGTGDAPDSGGATGTPVASSSSDGGSLLGDIGSFIGGNIGGIAEAGVVGGLGISEANAQKKQNDALAGSLSAAGAPNTALGGAINTQLQGGKQVSGPLGASIAQQTQAASELGNIATEYATGTTTPAQDQQLNDYASQQKAMVDSQLAASGNLDSSARQAAYQQIDNNVATMKQNLIAGNTQMASAALASVQQTYSTLLNQSLSESEFGFSTQEAAVQLQIQSDTQLSGQLQQLFAGIAKGFGNSSSSSGSSTGGAIGKAVAGAIKGVGTSSGGVASSQSGGGYGQPDTSGLDSDVIQSEFNTQNDIDANLAADDPFAGQSDIDSFFDSSSNDLQDYDFGGDPFGGDDG